MTLDPTAFRHEYDPQAAQRIRPRDHGFDMLVTPRYRHHYLDRSYERFTADLIAAMSPVHEVMVDVGAHYGFFSLLAAHHNPRLRVLACEPVEQTRSLLQRNLALNRVAQARALPVAVSDHAGRKPFQISLSSDNCGFHPHPVAPPIGVTDVETVTVDQLLADVEPCPLLVKIDTDGHEIEVLNGMAESFERFPDLRLFVELNPKMQRQAGREPEDLLTELHELGFATYLLDDEARRARPLNAPGDWSSAMADPASYANLYCCRRRQALSVAFVAHSDALSGAERSLLELVTELVRDHGILCTVVLPNGDPDADDGPLGRRLEAAGASVLRAGYGWWCEAWGEPRRDGDLIATLTPAATRLLAAVAAPLRDIDPDVVVTHTMAIPWGALLATVLGKPHVWNVCEYGDLDHALAFPRPFSDIVELIRASSCHLFVPSDSVRRHLFPDAGDELCTVLHRHVDLGEAPPAPDTDLYRRPGALRLAVFGSLVPNKGQDIAVQAAARLVERGLDVELLLAGSHPRPRFSRRLRHLVDELGLADHVRFVDFLENPHPTMAAADIVINACRVEAFGRVAVEALLLGRALVFPATGGLLELVEEGHGGIAYPAGDPAALADAVAHLAADPELRRRLGHQGRERVRAQLTPAAYGGTAARKLRCHRDSAACDHPVWRRVLAEVAIGATSRAAELEVARRRAEDERVRQRRRAAELQAVLDAIHDSAGWRLARRWSHRLSRVIPVGSLPWRALRRLVG